MYYVYVWSNFSRASVLWERSIAEFFLTWTAFCSFPFFSQLTVAGEPGPSSARAAWAVVGVIYFAAEIATILHPLGEGWGAKEALMTSPIAPWWTALWKVRMCIRRVEIELTVCEIFQSLAHLYTDDSPDWHKPTEEFFFFFWGGGGLFAKRNHHQL